MQIRNMKRQVGAAKKTLILAIVGVLVLVGGAVGVTMFMTGALGAKADKHAKAKTKKGEEKGAAEEGKAAEGEAAAGEEGDHAEGEGGEGGEPHWEFVKLDPPMIVNIQDAASKPHLLQLQMELRVSDPLMGEEINKNAAMIRNEIIVAATDLDPEKLRTGADRIRVQAQFKKIVDDTIKKLHIKGKVENVYFNSFVVQ